MSPTVIRHKEQSHGFTQVITVLPSPECYVQRYIWLENSNHRTFLDSSECWTSEAGAIARFDEIMSGKAEMDDVKEGW